jgi:hypothetical protein
MSGLLDDLVLGHAGEAGARRRLTRSAAVAIVAATPRRRSHGGVRRRRGPIGRVAAALGHGETAADMPAVARAL